MSELNLTVNKTVPAPPEHVFNAWLDPEMLVKFMVPMEGAFVSDAKVDAREGGQFSFMFMEGENQLPHSGTYKTIDRHSKLVFSWQSPFSVDGSTVSLTFKPNGNNATDVELYHEKFADEDSRNNHNSGWTSILDNLSLSF